MAGAAIIFDDSTPTSETHDSRFRRGMVARDYNIHPVDMFSALPTAQIPLIDPSEYDDRINEQEKNESSAEHIWNRSGLICLNQNGFGYCWAHSTVHGIILSRLIANEPMPPLSAVGLASIVKKGSDEGGWCGESADFARKNGVPLASAYPQDLGTDHLNDGRHQGQIDRILLQSYQKYNNAATLASGAFNKLTCDFTDLTRDVYDQNMTARMVDTCSLLNIMVPADFNWWGHSVLIGRLIGSKKTGYKRRIFNSWWDSPGVPWGENGWGTLAGSKMQPDQALGIIAVSAVGGP